MRLIIERSVHRDFWCRPVYRVTFAIDRLHPVERRIIEANGLLADQVWTSSAFSAFESLAESCFEAVENLPGLLFLSNAQVRRRMSIAREGLRALKDAQEGLASVADLLSSDGVSLESREVGHLLVVEAGIRSGFEALQSRLEHLARYEAQGGVVIEPEKTGSFASPAQWVRGR